MSSGGQTSTTTSGPPEWLSQYGPGIAEMIGGSIGQPYEPYGGRRVAPLSPMQQGALYGAEGAMWGSPGTQAGEEYAYNTMMGGSVNPFMDQVAGRVRGQVTDAYHDATSRNSAVFNRPGSFGSSAHRQEQDVTDTNLSRGLGDALSGVYERGFEADQGRRMQAAQFSQQASNNALSRFGQGLQLGDIERGYGQTLLDSAYGDFTEARDYPWSQLERAARVAGPMKGGAGQQSVTQGPGPDRVSQGLGTYALARSMGNKGGTGAA